MQNGMPPFRADGHKQKAPHATRSLQLEKDINRKRLSAPITFSAWF
jgi:hypothetical protein